MITQPLWILSLYLLKDETPIIAEREWIEIPNPFSGSLDALKKYNRTLKSSILLTTIEYYQYVLSTYQMKDCVTRSVLCTDIIYTSYTGCPTWLTMLTNFDTKIRKLVTVVFPP